MRKLISAVAIATLTTTVWAEDQGVPAADMLGTYTLRGKTVQVRPDPNVPDGLILVMDGEVRGTAQRYMGQKGWTFDVSGEPFGPAGSSVELRVRDNGSLRGRLKSPGRSDRRLDLPKQRRVLVLPNFDGNTNPDTKLFQGYAEQVKRYYRSQGWGTDVSQIHGADELLANLNTRAFNGQTYDRVVFIGHGGWDGPGLGKHFEQIGDGENPHLMPELAAALRRVTSVNAKVYASSCHAGGSNKYEEQGRYRWVDELARRSNRLVAGPNGPTSTEFTLNQVKAVLEGRGRTSQETRVAKPEGVKTLPYRGTLGSRTYSPWTKALPDRSVALRAISDGHQVHDRDNVIPPQPMQIEDATDTPEPETRSNGQDHGAAGRMGSLFR